MDSIDNIEVQDIQKIINYWENNHNRFKIIATSSHKVNELPSILDKLPIITQISPIHDIITRKKIYSYSIKFFVEKALPLFQKETKNIKISEEMLKYIANLSLHYKISNIGLLPYIVEYAKSIASIYGNDTIKMKDINIAIKQILEVRGKEERSNIYFTEQKKSNKGTKSYVGFEVSSVFFLTEDTNSEGKKVSKKGNFHHKEIKKFDITKGIIFKSKKVNENLTPLEKAIESKNQNIISYKYGEGSKVKSLIRGRYIRGISPKGEIIHIDFWKTLQNAIIRSALYQENNINITYKDIAIKEYIHKKEQFILFLLDTSGSMSINRIREAKGIIERLLEVGYMRRSKIAIISFRDREAKLILPPTTSISLAKSILDTIPTGGGTPLPSALYLAYNLISQIKKSKTISTKMIIISDCIGNVPIGVYGRSDITLSPVMAKKLREKAVKLELEKITSLFTKFQDIHIVIMDTSIDSKNTHSKELAKMLNASYFYLPYISIKKVDKIFR